MSGDDVQMLKAGILEIADIFVVNKADLPGADRTVQELKEMIHIQNDEAVAGHHRSGDLCGIGSATTDQQNNWNPPIVEAVAKQGDGVSEFLETLDDHQAWLTETGELMEQARQRYAAEIRTLLREDTAELVNQVLARDGGIESYVDAVADRNIDPYTVTANALEPLENGLESRSRE